jgi:SMODS and SLOG-associating 2TM effector domain family 4
MDPAREPILATARELYGRLVYTHMTHEKEREIWSKKVCRMNGYNVRLAVATTFFAIISATLRPTWAIYATAVFSLLTVGFVMWQSNFDPSGKEAAHRVTAKELLWTREQLLLLITDCHTPTYSQGRLERCLEMITRELTAVYKFAPNTSEEAYKQAHAAIKAGRFNFSDDEIDALLPTRLRDKQQ